jgi:ATP-dependent DNA ligase
MPARPGSLQLIRLQLATLVEEPPKGPDWLHEIKYDGYRTELIIERGRARAFTRRGADWSAKCRPIVEAAAELPVKSATVDGEVVAFEPGGRTSIEACRQALSWAPCQLVFAAFDLLYLNGEDLRGLAQVERRELLVALIGHAADGAIQFSEHVAGNGAAFYKQCCRLGLEGVVSKRADAPYRSGRSDYWLKTKCYTESAFRVAGIQRERGKPSYAVMASIENGHYVGSAFVALPKKQRDLLYRLAEAGGGSVPAGYRVKKNFPVAWISVPVVGRVLHIRGRHARLVEISM